MTITKNRPTSRRPRYRLSITPSSSSIVDGTRRPGGPRWPSEEPLTPSWDRALFYGED